jgi:hypothetical protein
MLRELESIRILLPRDDERMPAEAMKKPLKTRRTTAARVIIVASLVRCKKITTMLWIENQCELEENSFCIRY